MLSPSLDRVRASVVLVLNSYRIQKRSHALQRCFPASFMIRKITSGYKGTRLSRHLLAIMQEALLVPESKPARLGTLHSFLRFQLWLFKGSVIARKVDGWLPGW